MSLEEVVVLLIDEVDALLTKAGRSRFGTRCTH